MNKGALTSRYKLFSPEVTAYLPGRFATDVAVGSEAAAGNLTTRLKGEVEVRFGWGLPMGFTKIPDPPGIGMVSSTAYSSKLNLSTTHGHGKGSENSFGPGRSA